MNYLYLKESYYFTENKLYDGLFSSSNLNNDHTRNCERTEILTSDHLFILTLNKDSLIDPKILVKTIIKGDTIEFSLDITLEILYNIIKESNGLSDKLDFNIKDFFFYNNKFYSLEKNKGLLDSLNAKSNKELEKINKKSVITMSKLIPFQTYLDNNGDKYHVLCNALPGETELSKKIIVIKNIDNINSISEKELMNLMLNGNYDLLDKSIFVEKGDCFYFKENQTATGVENYLGKYRRYLLNNSIENYLDFNLPNSNLKFSDIVNQFKLKYPINCYSNLSNFEKGRKFYELYREVESLFTIKHLKEEECLNFAKNPVELFILYVYLLDNHLSERYLWDNKNRYRSHISFRFTTPGPGSFSNDKFVELFDKFILSIK